MWLLMCVAAARMAPLTTVDTSSDCCMQGCTATQCTVAPRSCRQGLAQAPRLRLQDSSCSAACRGRQWCCCGRRLHMPSHLPSRMLNLRRSSSLVQRPTAALALRRGLPPPQPARLNGCCAWRGEASSRPCRAALRRCRCSSRGKSSLRPLMWLHIRYLKSAARCLHPRLCHADRAKGG